MTIVPVMTETTAQPEPTAAATTQKKMASAEPATADKTAEADSSDHAKKSSPFPLPKLRLEVRDVNHAGADVFLGAVNAATVMPAAVANVQRLLYGGSSSKPGDADPATHMPPTRSVTVILRDMDGVAYTTGSELDGDHKEIHFSLRYIAGIQPRAARAAPEITGVLTHELVHCYQWNALGTAPGGLIEGIADWVRLRCSLEPPHWRREPAAVGRWDAGYQHTGYFLDYLENRFGSGTVRRINEGLRLHRYEDKAFWTGLLGRPVEQLWGDYVDTVSKGDPLAAGVAADV